MLARLFGCLTVGWLAGAACVVSPQPSPPVEEPELDGGLVGVGIQPEMITDTVNFQASPGAVDPAEGVVVITNLERDDAPSVAPVRDDGSFEIVVPGALGDTFRFQAKSDAGRSEPLDLVPDVSGVTPAPVGLACVALDPAAWLELDGAGDVRSIVVRNDCSTDVTLSPPRLRRGQAGFTFSPTQGEVLAAGASATVTVRAADAAEDEDILFLESTSPEPARRPVTLTR